jgi:hypothetical protein
MNGAPDPPAYWCVRNGDRRAGRGAVELVGACELDENGPVFSGNARPSFDGMVNVELLVTWNRAGAPR